MIVASVLAAFLWNVPQCWSTVFGFALEHSSVYFGFYSHFKIQVLWLIIKECATKGVIAAMAHSLAKQVRLLA
jgi:hypothetical protein